MARKSKKMPKAVLGEQARFSADRKKIILWYSGLFCIMATLIYGGFFWAHDRSLVYFTDAFRQHCMVLTYLGEYYRTILRNIFVEHSFEIPMFDFSIGFGYDITSSLSYYGFGDPLNLLSVFFSPEKTEYLYGFLSVTRMYIAGLNFSLFMQTKKNSCPAVLTGAMAYAFCAYSMGIGISHTFMMTGLMYLPLVLLGIDRVLEGKRPTVYILSLALTVLSNFYMAYMVCIFMVLYAAVHYLVNYRKDGFSAFLKTVGKFFVYSVTALLIPMMIFFPQVYNMLQVDRLNVKYAIDAIHSIDYYTALPGNFLADYSIGLTGIALLAVLAVCIRCNKHKPLSIFYLIGFIFLSFPFFGHLFNGFGYESTRWRWILAFLASASITMMYDELFEFSKKEKKMLLIAAVGYLALVLCLSKSRIELTFVALAVMMIALGLILAVDAGVFTKKFSQRALSGLLVVSVLIQALYAFSITKSNRLDTFFPEGEVYKYMAEDTASATIKKIDESGEFFRYDNYWLAACNDAMLNGQHSTTFFLSVSSPAITKFIKNMGYNVFFEQQIENNHNRMILHTLTGVKYMLGRSLPISDYYLSAGAPPTFQNSLTIDDANQLTYNRGVPALPIANNISSYIGYENLYYLPMGYTYDAVLDRKTYETMTPAEHQNAVLQAAGVDEEVPLPSIMPDSSYLTQRNIFPMVEETDGLKIEGNKIIVTKQNASFSFTAPVVSDSENYLYVGDLKYEAYNPYDVSDAEIEEGVTKLEKMKEEKEKKKEEAEREQTEEEEEEKEEEIDTSIDKLALHKYQYRRRYSGEAVTSSIAVKSDSFSGGETIHYYGPAAMYYSGYNTYLSGICRVPSAEYTEIPKTQKVTVSFQNVGEYTVSSLQFVTQKLSVISDYTGKRQKEVLENVTVGNNLVSGDISISSPKLLATQIPYSEGWKVKVDGGEAKLLCVNSGFCGVMLDTAGEHAVEFTYVTPHLALALGLTGLGIVFFAGCEIFYTVSRKKEKITRKNKKKEADSLPET